MPLQCCVPVNFLMAATEETDVDVNYFVCTLGEAATINAVSPQPFETVNEFLKYQSQRVPNHAAVGIPIPSQLPDGPKEWDYTVLSALPSHPAERSRCCFSI